MNMVILVIYQIDLEYPAELHDIHGDYPLAPEIMCIDANMISDVSKNIYKAYNSHEIRNEKTPKLILNVMNKKRYVVNISVLKYYLEMGLKLTTIHRCITYKQKAWLKPWIDLNTSKRKEANNDFEKDLFKLMNNAVYGKTMEDVRNHLDLEIVKDKTRFEKL